MAKVRCPMCGETNPAEAAICQYCLARLKPFVVEGSDEQATPSDVLAPNKSDDLRVDMPDWLVSLRNSQNMELPADEPAESAASLASSPESQPDYLSRLEDSSPPSPAIEQAGRNAAPPNSKDLNDESKGWLNDLMSKVGPSLDEDSPRQHADESLVESDWWRSFDGEQAKTTPQPPAAAPTWLSDLEKTTPDIGSPQLPDWLAQEEEIRATPGERVPDWLVHRASVELPPEPPAASEPTVEKTEPEAPKRISWPVSREPYPEKEEPAQPVDSGFPDWLASANESIPEQPTPSELEIPGFASEFGDGPAASEQPGWLSDEQSKTPAWLSQPEQENSALPVEPSTAESGGELPNWLAGAETGIPEWLSQPAPQASAAEQPPAQTDAGIPEWLKQPVPEAQPSSTEQPAASELPDWLAEITEDKPAAGPVAASPDQAAMSEIPSWLAGPKEEIPDWLSQVASEAVAPEPTSPVEPAEAELPGWLEGVGAGPESEAPDWLTQAAPAAAPAVEPPTENELPDWLVGAGLNAEAAETSKAVSTDDLLSKEPAPTPGVTEWLAQLTAQPQESQASQPAVEAEPEIPAWLAESRSEVPDWLVQSTPDARSSALEQPAAQDELEIPDWMAGSSASETTPGLDRTSVDQAAQMGDIQDEEVPGNEMPGEITPDWMAAITGPTPSASEGTAQTGKASTAFVSEGGEPFGEDLSWLDELEAAYPGMPSGKAVVEGGEAASGSGEFVQDGLEPVAGGPLPAWLTSATSGGASSSEGETELEPAELPSWLQAMRPVATVGSAAVAEQAEKGEPEGAGPLAGLRGALPAEPDVYPTAKPSAYSVKLQVSEAQQTNADLLEKLVKAEAEARAVPGRPVITSQLIIRMAIAAVLFFAILFTMLTGFPEVGLPALAPETSQVRQLVDSLPAGAPVLLAIDYQPGLSGEMDAAASALVDHLMAKGAYLAVVSTLPTGPVQAERLIGLVNASGLHQYSAAGQYTNLGFVPGGPAGLLSFAQTPRDAFPMDIAGNSAWASQSLQKVQSLADFALVIVATENPDTARAWIEQVQPLLVRTPANTPLVLVLSAQAEPLVRPYYENSPSQVQGVLVGLASSASYETLLGRNGLAKSYWNIYSIGILAAVVLILIGGAITALLARMNRDKVSLEGEEKT